MYVNYQWSLYLCVGETIYARTISRPFIPSFGMLLVDVTKVGPVSGWKINEVKYSVADNEFFVSLASWRDDLTLEDLGDGWE